MFNPDEATKKLKEKLLSEKRIGIALDIDDTLAATNEIFFKVLYEKFGNPENLSVEEGLNKYSITHNVPYWQTDEVKKFMVDVRRSTDINISIPPTKDSVSAIKEISKEIECLCYLTARPESLRKLTEEWLRKNNFPDIPVIMRPDEIDDAHITIWKGPILEYLYPSVIGIIDDNPGFAKTVSPEYKGTLFLYNNKKIPDIHIKTLPGKTWSDVINNIKNHVTKK